MCMVWFLLGPILLMSYTLILKGAGDGLHGSTSYVNKVKIRRNPTMAMWYENFPAECPPTEARADNVLVYRLVNSVLPEASDFLPTKAEQPERNFKPDEACAACGVSVFRNVQDIIQKQSRYKALRSKKVAIGKITCADGLVLETFTPSHMTWWLRTSTPHSNFVEYKGNGTA